jgi:hypothetical protein
MLCRFRILSEGNTHTIFLEVFQITKKDSGLYKVVAKNAKGDGVANIELNIEGIDFKYVAIETSMKILFYYYLDYPKVLHHHFLINHQ